MSNTQKMIFLTLGGLGLGAIVWAVVSHSKKKKLPPADVSFPIALEALKYVGIKEIEDNKGWENADDFTAKMKAAGWQTGWPYCVGFVKMVFMQCCKGAALDFFAKNISWNTLTTWDNLTQPNNFCKIAESPDMGCLVCYKGHTEICLNVLGDGYMDVVTANSYGKDGNGNTIQGVFRKRRKIGSDLDGDKFLGFIKILKID